MANYKNLDQLESFNALKNKYTKAISLKEELTTERVTSFQITTDLDGEYLKYNYAAKQVNDQIIDQLQKLSEEHELIAKYKAILNGEYANTGENRRVLHHLLRGQTGKAVIHEGKNLKDFYIEQQNRIYGFAAQVHSGAIKAQDGSSFDTVVQVGIGGSDLGPRALYLALRNYVAASKAAGLKGSGEKMVAHFISNVDPDDAADVLRGINPKSTLFILVSKSGTTQETLTNEALVISAMEKAGIKNPKKQIICVTSETSPLAKSSDYLDSFFIDDFIGGRYSGTSAVGGAVLSLAFGKEIVEELLLGAHLADKAALQSNIHNNASLLDALIGVFERNVLGYDSTAILPYSQALSRFPAHLQQADMESNGKQVNREGKQVNYATGPVIFGEPGTNGQHSFYQLLHQGTDTIPLQFIGFKNSQDGLDVDMQGSSSQTKLNANLVAQITAFALGQKNENPNKHFPGERPSSLILGEILSPRFLGALLSHFENKILFQGLIWNLNSFDQEGVQLGKVLTKQVLSSDKIDPVLESFSKLLGVR